MADKAKLEQLITLMAEEPEVRALAQPDPHPTTRNDYGGYLQKILRLAKDSPLLPDSPDLTEASQAKLWASVLITAGGDVQGIRDAIRVTYGH